jgi:hypothetical protein
MIRETLKKKKPMKMIQKCPTMTLWSKLREISSLNREQLMILSSRSLARL